jgi:hypothetical protein
LNAATWARRPGPAAGLKALLAAALLAVGTAALAVPVTLAGRFDDPFNAALVGSDLGNPSFTDDRTVANNVALYAFDVVARGVVTIQSRGFAAGGTDPYFSLFLASGLGASFIDSNAAQAFSSGGDFLYAALLEAGEYQIALGSFANLSFAENRGSGVLGDGFVGLGEPGALGDSSYRLTLTAPGAAPALPEPATLPLLLIGLGALGIRGRAWRRAAVTTAGSPPAR